MLVVVFLATGFERPVAWFAYSAGCFAVSLLLYVYDYRLILARRADFADTEERRALYEHIVRRQRLEMRALIPAGLAFNVVAWALVRARPETATMLASCNFSSVLFMILFVRSFEERQRRITASARAN